MMDSVVEGEGIRSDTNLDLDPDPDLDLDLDPDLDLDLDPDRVPRRH
jgi:hypothetical protein